MTGTEIVKKLKEMKRVNNQTVNKISVTVAEYEGGWDVYANVWYSDRWGNDDFKDFTLDAVEEEKKAVTKAKRLTNTLDNHGFRVKYEGIENC